LIYILQKAVIVNYDRFLFVVFPAGLEPATKP